MKLRWVQVLLCKSLRFSFLASFNPANPPPAMTILRCPVSGIFPAFFMKNRKIREVNLNSDIFA
jgi:hypothetical protein